MLQPRDGAQHGHLHVLGQGGGEALDIELLGVQAHGFDEELVALLIGKADHLVLNGGTIAGSHPLDHPGVEGGAVQIGPDDRMGLLVGIGEPAHRPVFRRLLGLKGEGDGSPVSLLALYPGEIHTPGVDPGGRARLEAAQAQPQLLQASGEGEGGGQPVRAGVPGQLPHDGTPAQMGTCGDDHRAHGIDPAGGGAHGPDRSVLREDVGDLSLLEPEVLLTLQGALHDLLVFPPVGLGPQGPDRRSLSLVEHPVLDAGRVGRPGHLASQGVQLPDQVALSRAADGGITGHIAHRVQIDGEAQGAQAQTGGGQSRLDPGVAGADNGDIIFSSVIVHTRS